MSKKVQRRRGPAPSVRSHQLPEIVGKLIAWRRRNGLSQRDAVRVLQSHFFRISLAGLASWEQGRRGPMPQSARLLDELLTRFPLVSVEQTETRAEFGKNLAPTGATPDRPLIQPSLTLGA
jgi:DNA-binding transcriptional regulator YiaG